MKTQARTVRKILFAVCLAFLGSVALAEDYLPLANTVRKLKAGSLNIAVVGDSIGWGQGVSSARIQGIEYGNRVTFNSAGMPKGNPMGYARVTTDYIKYLASRDFGVKDASINAFYSVWGGATTRSAFAYFCDDIVARRPDLLIYEVWNDCPESLRYAENTLRTLWKQCPETDVLLVSVGGSFAKSAVYQPLVKKYGIKWIDAYASLESWFGQFGTVHSNDYGVVDPNGKVRGTRGFLFANSAPHVTEEGYVWFNDKIVAALDGLFAAAKGASGACVAVAPAGSLDNELIPAKGDADLHSEIVSPRSLVAEGLVDVAGWTATVAEVLDEPRDTMDRASGDVLTAKAADATITKTVTGRVLNVRSCKDILLSVNDGAFAPVRAGSFVSLSDKNEDVRAKLVFKASSAKASLREFYVYGSAFRAIPSQATKHRYSVKYFAKVATQHYHDWHLCGQQVMPHPLTWLNCFRSETYGAPVTVPKASVISAECSQNGSFLGWVEPDEVVWNGSERQMVVKTHAGKKIYVPGEKIDVAALGHDLTLVAAYSNGPLPATNVRTFKVVFASENTVNLKTLKLTEVAAEGSRKVVMPDCIPPKAGFKAVGWTVVNDEKVYPVGTEAELSADTEFVPAYQQSVFIDEALLANCWTLKGGLLADGSGWSFKTKTVGTTLKIVGVAAQPDPVTAPNFGKPAVNEAHDALYMAYDIEGNVFKKSAMTGELNLGYVTTIGAGAFWGTGVSSVSFGAYLEGIGGAWGNGAFQNCAALTKVVFDPKASATVSSGEGFTFQGCTALETADLSGVAVLRCGNAMRSIFGGCKNLKSVIVREGAVTSPDVFANSNAADQKIVTIVPRP